MIIIQPKLIIVGKTFKNNLKIIFHQRYFIELKKIFLVQELLDLL